MKRVKVRLRLGPEDEREVGELAEAERGRVFFEYAPAFLATGWQPSPFRLPARPGLVEHTDRAFGPLPGVFDDSLPDGWGRLLMDRHFRREGLDPMAVSPLDRLIHLGRRTMGALTYHPPESDQAEPIALDLPRLAENASEVLRGSAREVLPELRRAGGSPGGARPKVVVGLRADEVLSGEDDLPEGFEAWIIKFTGNDDGSDYGAVEHAYMEMAQASGIHVPSHRLIGEGPWFAVQRFDRRSGNRRLHTHTLGGLLHSDFRIPACDYDQLLRVTRALTRDRRAVVECFRRMVFNVATHNRDDHVKNFAFLMDDAGEWTVSPAYDLVFSRGPGGEHSMTVDGEGRAPNAERCIALGKRHGISAKEAKAVIEQVADAVATWPKRAAEAGVRIETIGEISQAHRRVALVTAKSSSIGGRK
jgi:serine/threonine-protein kinase HipA